MGDTVFEYIAASAAVQPRAMFTAADAGQSTVMDNIAAAIDVDTTLMLNRPTLIEFVSPTIEVGQSFMSMEFKSSPITERILFETSPNRMAFIQEAMSQISLIPVALGKPVQPETVWRDSQFQAAQQNERDAIDEIDAAPDVQTRVLIRDPLIQYIRSPTVRVNEIVLFINFPNTTEAFRVYVSSTLDFMQFVQHFILPLATAVAIGTNV